MNRWTPYAPLPLPLLGQSAQDIDEESLERSLRVIAQCGASTDLIEYLWKQLADELVVLDTPHATLTSLSRFVDVSRSPTSLLALFQRDKHSLSSLLQVLATSPRIAALLIRDPESFDLIRASDGQPSSREILMDEIKSELESIQSTRRAAITIARFAGREILRIAYGEFVRSLPPDHVGTQISHVTDAILSASLNKVIQGVSAELGIPQRVDNSEPKYAIIALGNYGGEEIGYDSPLDILLLCDQVDRRNESHVRFNERIASELSQLVGLASGIVDALKLNFVMQPGEDTNKTSDSVRLGDQAESESGKGNDAWSSAFQPKQRYVGFHTVDEAADQYERSDKTWQRLGFVKARLAAGNEQIGSRFLSRIEPWVYHRLLSRSEIADIQVLRRKLEKRASASQSDQRMPLRDRPGGRRDVELTIQFLQLLHGGELPEVRVSGTLSAIAALSRNGCLTHQEASILSENHARLCRLEHHLAVLFDHPVSYLPDDIDVRERLAWRLGVRRISDQNSGSERGDHAKFESLLAETFEVNQKIINHLMVSNSPKQSKAAATSSDEELPATDASDPGQDQTSDEQVAVETELVLDPDPDLQVYRDVLKSHGFRMLDRAIDSMTSLSEETVAFLSPRRCRHFFAAVAPDLLKAISKTPDPDNTLIELVRVTDSIGAKATLWELLRTNNATLTLMVRLCAETPLLARILVDHPGMIDELIDSLVIDRLPTAERLDSQSIRLCQGAVDIGSILMNFKASSHLLVGVRDLLGKEDIDAICRSISDTADACLRRVIEIEQEKLSQRYGDPVDGDGQPVELVAVALGKFGSQETNYHSDLDLTFLYTSDGETKRRVGGPRSTLSNKLFFNQLVQNVVREMHDNAGQRLYDLDLVFMSGPDETVYAKSIPHFLKPFRLQTASLWNRMVICQARPVSGSKAARERVDKAFRKAIALMPWRTSYQNELIELRDASESTASPANLKRGQGGSLDVQWIATASILKNITKTSSLPLHAGTIAKLDEAVRAGIYEAEPVEKLKRNYSFLLSIQAKLRLVNTLARHELPLMADGGTGSLAMKQLSSLMRQTNPEDLVQQCETIRDENREIFELLLSESSDNA